VPELAATMPRHLYPLVARGGLAPRRRHRRAARIDAHVEAKARARFRARVPAARRDTILARVEARTMTPAEAARTMFDEAWPTGPAAAETENAARAAKETP
jgi:hypothetical protein